VTNPAIPPATTDRLVAKTWIGSIPGFTMEMVGDRLPPDVNPDRSQAAWIRTGFVTVATSGGNPDQMLPVSKPVISLKVWAALPGSNDPPWGLAEAIGAAITRATWDRTGFGRPLTPVVDGVVYPVATVKSAYMATTFRRLYDDAADYACLQGDLALTWTSRSQIIP
jgi:hypothetical protein